MRKVYAEKREVRAGGRKHLAKRTEDMPMTNLCVRPYGFIPTSDAPPEKLPIPEKAVRFNRLETKHHRRHAKEMGFKNTRDYERAAIEFFNSNKGTLYYSRARGRFYRYDEKTKFFVSSSSGVIHAFDFVSKSEFMRKIRQDKLDEQ